MSLSIRVSYPKRITIPSGAAVVIHAGIFDEPDHLVAYSINDGDSGIEYHLHPDEYPKAQEYRGEIHWKLPLVAQVLSCMQYGEYTHIDVYPSTQTLYEFSKFREPSLKLAVPAFWQLAEERDDWREVAIPTGFALREAKERRPRPLDARDTARAFHECFAKKRFFHLPRCNQAIWESAQKLQQAARHLNRLKAIDQLRLHLYDAPKSEGRDFMLSETREEAEVIVEAALTAVYTSLDILGHAINEFFQLGLATNSVGFINTVAGKNTNLDAKCLNREYPHEPLTSFLLGERVRWIRELEGWRHHVIHHGTLQTGEIARGGVMVVPPDEDEFQGAMTTSRSATELVDGWVSDLRLLLKKSFELLAERSRRLTATSDSEFPVGTRGEFLMVLDRMPKYKTLVEFLQLWGEDEETNPSKYQYMYSKLTGAWRSYCQMLWISSHKRTALPRLRSATPCLPTVRSSRL